VRWISASQRFEDPCSGSKFAINGGYLEGPAWSHLIRYPVQIEGDTLSIDLSRQLEETKIEFSERCFQAQRQRSARWSVDPQTESQPCRHGVCFDLREYVPNFAVTDFCQDLWQNHQRQWPYFRMFNP
jgi:hypothetical protein